MTRHLLTTLEGDDSIGSLGLTSEPVTTTRILPGERSISTGLGTASANQSAPKSNTLFWIAALGAGLYLLTRKA